MLTAVLIKALAVIQSALVLYAVNQGLGVKQADLSHVEIGHVQKVRTFQKIASGRLTRLL